MRIALSPKMTSGITLLSAPPTVQLPPLRDGMDMFQSYADGKLAFTVPEYQLPAAVPISKPKALDEFHSAKYQLGFAVVPRFVRTYFRYSPDGPAKFVPPGTFVMFMVVSTPERGSY